jgi:putative peptidoglycan lipid II flippase
VGLILLGRPIIEFLFQRGQFNAQSTDLVDWALVWFSAGLVAHGVVEITSRAFYAQHDTKTPVIIGIGAMALNILLSLSLSVWFSELGWPPHGGLALANSLATTLEMGVLLYFMRMRLGGLEGRAILTATAQSAAAATAMGSVLLLWLDRLPPEPAWLVAVGGVLAGAAVYGVVILVLGVPEGQALVRAARRRLLGR